MKKAALLIKCMILMAAITHAQVLDKQAMLDRFQFWHNRDWTWYKNNIPFFECPDNEIDLTYYYRWDMMTSHLVYGSPQSGYAFTEFIDRPGWSGKYGAISCSVGHHLYELRWLKNKRFVQDYSKYWFVTDGAQPRNYSTWLADAIWQGYKVNFDKEFIIDLRPAIIKNYEGWEKERYISDEGLFAWDGMHDGMENNITSRQTSNAFAGAPGYRPTLNSYMWADAMAIKNISLLDNDTASADFFEKKAAGIKNNLQLKCWDNERKFFLHRFYKDEDNGIKANSLTYQTGKYAGNKYGRELMGYVPWYFNLPDTGYEEAWKFLMDTVHFFTPYGPVTAEIKDPLFFVDSTNCCSWSGNGWPFATSQTLKAMANVIRNYHQTYINKDDYFRQLKIYALTHRKNGSPYLAESHSPFTGSWEGGDKPGHSEHYFHSSYVDEIITGLIGLQPSDKDSIIVDPLIPDAWEYFALDDIKYHGNAISILWDKTGARYKKGKGLMIISNNEVIAHAATIQRLSAHIKYKPKRALDLSVNYAVDNEKNNSYPLVSGSNDHDIDKINDGQYWYYTSTTNKWSAHEKSPWCAVDFGVKRPIHTIKLYFTEAPDACEIQYWNGSTWKKLSFINSPKAQTANTLTFKQINTSRIRVKFTLQKMYTVALSELEAWGSKY